MQQPASQAAPEQLPQQLARRTEQQLLEKHLRQQQASAAHVPLHPSARPQPSGRLCVPQQVECTPPAGGRQAEPPNISPQQEQQPSCSAAAQRVAQVHADWSLPGCSLEKAKQISRTFVTERRLPVAGGQHQLVHRLSQVAPHARAAERLFPCAKSPPLSQLDPRNPLQLQLIRQQLRQHGKQQPDSTSQPVFQQGHGLRPPPLHAFQQIQQRLLLQAAAQQQLASAGSGTTSKLAPSAVAAAAAAVVRSGALQLLLRQRRSPEDHDKGISGPVAPGFGATDLLRGANPPREAAAATAAAVAAAASGSAQRGGGMVVPSGVASRICTTQASVDSTTPGKGASDGGSGSETCTASRSEKVNSERLRHTCDPGPGSCNLGHGDPNRCTEDSGTCGRTGSRQSDAASATEAPAGVQSLDDSGQPMGGGSTAEVKRRHSFAEAQMPCEETDPLEGSSSTPQATNRAAKPTDFPTSLQCGKVWTKAVPRVEEVSLAEHGAMAMAPKAERDEEERHEKFDVDDVFRYTEDEEASDSVKRRHTLEMPVGWGVTKPVAEATGSGGTFKKVIWVNETVGGIRRQVYCLENTRDWCVQFFRSSDFNAKLLTKTFPETELTKFRAMAAAYNLMPWDCTDSEFRRPQGRPLKRRVFTARDFEEGTAWNYYPPTLLLHPHPTNSSSSARGRRKAEPPLIQASDSRGGTNSLDCSFSGSCASSTFSDSLSCPNETLATCEASFTRRGTRQPCITKVRENSSSPPTVSNEGAVCDGIQDCCTSPTHSSRADSPSAMKSAAAHSPQRASRTLGLPPGLVDCMATLAAAVVRGDGAGQDDGDWWSKEGGEKGEVDGERRSEKGLAKAHWHDRTAAGANAESEGSGGLNEKRQKRLPRWPPGQNAAEEKEATSLLRQLILEQLEENPGECVASWSRTLMPWSGLAVPCTTNTPSPQSGEASAWSSPDGSSDCAASCVSEADGELGAPERLPKRPHQLQSPQILLDSFDNFMRQKHPGVLPPAPSASLGQLFCHLCCAPDRRNALGRRAFSKVLQVVFPDYLEAAVSAQVRSTDSRETKEQNVFRELRRRHQTLENHILVSRVLRALAKKENDEFLCGLLTQCSRQQCQQSTTLEEYTAASAHRRNLEVCSDLAPATPDNSATHAVDRDPSTDDAVASDSGVRSETKNISPPPAPATQLHQERAFSLDMGGHDAGRMAGTTSVRQNTNCEKVHTTQRKSGIRCSVHEIGRECEAGSTRPVCDASVKPNDPTSGECSGMRTVFPNGYEHKRELMNGIVGHRKKRRCEPTPSEVLRVLGWVLNVDDDNETAV
ncbi:hypothetical protein CSUI_006157 [Cystoisospora suis]|uniref:Uncharacterized protein n=1 Tax=Cystoisospora suis TaxID=483139 RepID=A0A2C6KUG9_9APIC|nr:hypothetical protein CSUI_006157 [Cystoisospora suis]